jgi:hypothetical protein
LGGKILDVERPKAGVDPSTSLAALKPAIAQVSTKTGQRENLRKTVNYRLEHRSL